MPSLSRIEEAAHLLTKSRNSLFLCLYYPSGCPMRLPDIVRIQRILSATEIRKFDLLLHSHGGDYRVAYKVATMISNHLAGDGRSTVFVPLYCLSAATLLAMVGHELVISEPGWLGPIDPQLQIADIGVGSDQKQSRRLSSHTLQHVLQTLGNYIDESSAGSAKSRLFADYLLRPLTEEIDPFLVVNSIEYEKTVYEYGVRILARRGVSASLAAKAIQYLMSRPTHDYVIDAREISSSILNDVFTLVDPIHLPAEVPAAIETIFGEIMNWERTAEPEQRAHPYMYSYDGRAVE